MEGKNCRGNQNTAGLVRKQRQELPEEQDARDLREVCCENTIFFSLC